MPAKTPKPKTGTRKPAAKKPGAEAGAFPDVFARLKAILLPYAAEMIVVKDDPTWYYLDSKLIGHNKKPIMFAAVRLGKAYVSYYLMCVYSDDKWLAEMSPELQKRMQGKACFNFTAIDEPLFEQLEAITKSAAEFYENGGLEKMLKKWQAARGKSARGKK